MDLEKIIEESNKISTEKGFWDDYDNSIKKMKNLPKHFSDEDIERIKLAFFSEKLSLVASELSEALEAMRSDKFYESGEDGLKTLEELENDPFRYQVFYRTHFKDTFEDEISDAFIRLCDLCYKMNIDIETFIKNKIEYNRNRQEKHGKRF